jgi:hypothetical protein
MYKIVFLMMNIRCSKHVENSKSWIKTVIKNAICWLALHKYTTMHGTKNVKWGAIVKRRITLQSSVGRGFCWQKTGNTNSKKVKVKVKVKVQFTLQQATKAQTGSTAIALRWL